MTGQALDTPRRRNLVHPQSLWHPPDTMAQSLRKEVQLGLDEALAEGNAAYDRGDLAAAHAFYRQAQQIDGNDPRVLSCLGMTLVVFARDEQKGVAFCEEALRRGGESAEYLWRLAVVYQATYQRERAVRALRRGLELEPYHRGMVGMLQAVGIRRPPVFPFLKRSNPINKYLGILRHRFASAKDEG